MIDKFINRLGIEFVRIKAGCFTMGAVDGDPDAEWNEWPSIEATVSEDIFLATKPLTVEQFATFCYLPVGEHIAREPQQAANYISAMDADVFVDAMNANRTIEERRITYMLPSESEWEYACRAGTRTRFYYGEDLTFGELDNHAWYANNAWHAGLFSPQRPGQKGMNPWGLHDMHGNVWEWTRDGWGLYAEISQFGDGARDRSTRVLRGGAWCHDARYLRASDRDHYPPNYRHYYTGMRLAFRFK